MSNLIKNPKQTNVNLTDVLLGADKYGCLINIDPAIIKGGGSGGGGTIIQENIIRVPSATYSELGVTPESTIEEKQAAIAAFLEGYNNDGKDVLFFEIKENPINFDVTSTDWVGISESDFITVLEGKGNANVVVNLFTNTNGRIECVLQTNNVFLNLSGLNITQVSIVNIEGLEALLLNDNQITEFNPTVPLPSVLQGLALHNNQISEFNPTLPLPEELQHLILENNQITEFNPTLQLPERLQNLDLNSNQITVFNPTVPLPEMLQNLGLYNNQIADWSLSESWANSLPNGSAIIRLYDNLTSSEGTNLKTILESKGWEVRS